MNVPGKLPSLDGWRAFSIFLVLLSHLVYFHQFPTIIQDHLDGVLGVRFFFTISGFLITWLMLREEASNGIVDLKNFYIRRTLRIWPVYFLFVLFCLFLNWTGSIVQSPDAWRGVFTFTRNFHDQIKGYDGDWLTVHLWSLSVEEQFYLVWPLVFVIKGFRIWFVCIAIVFSIGFKTVQLFGVYSHYIFQVFSTFNYLDDLGWGCLGAFVFQKMRHKLENLPDTYVFGVGFISVFVPYVLQFGKSLQAFGIIILLIHSVLRPSWFLYRILNLKWVKFVGVISYSVYIWQIAVVVLWPRKLWLLWMPACLLAGWISYQFYEKRFLRLKEKFKAASHLSLQVRRSESIIN